MVCRRAIPIMELAMDKRVRLLFASASLSEDGRPFRGPRQPADLSGGQRAKAACAVVVFVL